MLLSCQCFHQYLRPLSAGTENVVKRQLSQTNIQTNATYVEAFCTQSIEAASLKQHVVSIRAPCWRVRRALRSRASFLAISKLAGHRSDEVEAAEHHSEL
jgi:hypothetical protein